MLLVEHSVLVSGVLSLAHEEIIEVLELALQKFECLLGLNLVSELLGQSRNDIVDTQHHIVFKIGKQTLVSLFVQ